MLIAAILVQSSVQKQNLNLHTIFKREKSDLWFVNLTDIEVPYSVQDILRLGKGFSSNMMNDKSKQMIEIVKNSEANIHKIPMSDQQDFKNKVLDLSKALVEKKSLQSFTIFLCLCKRWWEIKANEDERKKKKKGVLEGCLLFSFLLFCWFFSSLFDLGNVFLVQIW